MECSIQFEMDNAAFADYPMEEAARILRNAADKMEAGAQEFSLRDINGNTIGRVDITQ